MGGGERTLGGGSSVECLSPTSDAWDAPNPPEIKFVFSGTPGSMVIGGGGTTLTDPNAGLALVVDAFIYDTHISTLYRVERVMEYAASSGGGIFGGGLGGGGGEIGGGGVTSVGLILGANWDGTYETRSSGVMQSPGMFGPPTIGPASAVGIGTLRRKTPLVTGTPVAIMFGTYVVGGRGDPVLTYAYAWWFGVGPREAWDWPRSGESAQFVGKRMPPPFDKVAPIFQVADRDDKSGSPRYKIPTGYAGVDGSTPDGRVVKAATVTQAVVKSQGRMAPPVFATGAIVEEGGGIKPA